tara:strand:- start:48054 stop:48653 length:600 start_codon:yes stop_codon:yes gene_type:complete
MGISVAAQIPDAVTIDTLGNVGIGTSRPSEKLEVKGRIKDTTGFVMPSGGIIMWSGALNKIPQGWALCNGQNGTPDLQDKFIVGAGQKYAVQQTGGLDAVTLLENQMPVHTHQGGSDSQQSFLNYEGVLWNSKGVQARGIVIYNGRGLPGNRPNAANTYNLPNPETNQHSHAISVANSGGGLAHENRPPYMALCYIMKL